MNIIFIFFIFFSILFYLNANKETLISLEINKLNNRITNENYSKENIHIIGLSIDDNESNGVEIQFNISTSWDSPFPFSSSIKYIELTKGFTTPSQYLYNIEMLYMIQLNLENKIIFSFSCTNVTNTSLCGFYLNENLINFEENKYIKEQINTNIELGYVLQNNSNTIIHYMNYNDNANLIIFRDINNKIENPQILIFLPFYYITYNLLSNE